MVTGASNAHVALILIDARKGVIEQTRRHAFLSSMLGVPHMVVCVNKMDLIDWDQDALRADQVGLHGVRRPAQRARHHVHPHLRAAGRQRRAALREHVVVRRLAAAQPPRVGLHRQRRELHRPPLPGAVRHPEPDAGEPGLPGLRRDGGQRRAAAGRRGAGHAHRARRRASPPSSRPTARWPRRSRPWRSSSRWRTTSRCRGATSCAGPTTARPCRTTSRRRCAGWTSARRWPKGAPYLLKHSTRTVRATVQSLQYRLDINGLHRDETAATLELNEIGRVSFRCTEPLLVDDYTTNRATGSFIVIDPTTNATVGRGRHPGHRHHARQPQRGAPRRAAVAAGPLRGARDVGGDASCSPGSSGAGKSTLAAGVEEAFVRSGRPAFLLDGDNLRHGLNGDLGFSDRDRTENVRRAGEVARMFAESGSLALIALDLPVRGGPPAHPGPARARRPPLRRGLRRHLAGGVRAARPQGPLRPGPGRAAPRLHRHRLGLRGADPARPGARSRCGLAARAGLPRARAAGGPAPLAGSELAYSWTSSIRVPNDVLGCTKATVVPREPGPRRLVDDPAAGVLDRLQAPRRSRPPGSRRGGAPRPCWPGTWRPASRRGSG